MTCGAFHALIDSSFQKKFGFQGFTFKLGEHGYWRLDEIISIALIFVYIHFTLVICIYI